MKKRSNQIVGNIGTYVFVMTQKEISDRAHQDSKGAYWVEFTKFGKTDEFLEKWNRIEESLK